jgi:hypothetical protein
MTRSTTRRAGVLTRPVPPLALWVFGAAALLIGWRRRRRERATHRPTRAAESPAETAPPPRIEDHVAAIPQEGDHVGRRRAAAWMAAGIVLVIVGVGWPWTMMALRGLAPPVRSGVGYGPPAPAFTGGLRTEPFRHAAMPHARSADHLDRFEWADADARLVRIPIDDAIELWLSRHGRGDDGD